jgi:hypothetical protein
LNADGKFENYFFTRSQLGYRLLISRGPTKFLGIKIFSVDVKEISKHSDKNGYRLYECLLNADIFVLKMKKCPDTVTMCLLKADMFSLREEHVMKSMQGWRIGIFFLTKLGNFVMGHF